MSLSDPISDPVSSPIDQYSLGRFLKRYGIFFAPALCIVFLVAQSYQMDFRSFYVAGRSVVLGLNPYLNPVTDFPELFGAGNAGDSPASGFRYPPLAALLLMPLGLIPSYEVARIIFSLLMLVCFGGVCYLIARHLKFQLSGVAIVFALCSFPVLALFERGQIDILLVLMLLGAFLLQQEAGTKSFPRLLAALLLALATQIKVFPGFLLIYFLWVKRDWRFGLYTLGCLLLLGLGAYAYFGSEVYGSFLQRSLPTVFGGITMDQPVNVHDQQVVYHYIVLALQGNNKIFAQDFVNGRMNPLFFNRALGALIFGLVSLVGMLFVTRRQPADLRFFKALTTINLLNALAWVMGVVWYIPLFLALYDRVGTRGKALLLLPLFLPPLTLVNAYGAALIGFLMVESPEKQDARAVTRALS